ncbi:hypothetical protein V5O48_003295 [Marasmius crinis-equi]|uniref:Uncharacterized protein n=1 Tax=Marasmius crinis-equi TaxID=585013 RepID=A0ABR3FT56_9AGAR
MSSPSVRSSPYPSLSSGNGSATRTGGNGYRRSSGSDVASRRVLADIEWWRVTVGQRDLDAEQELEDNNRDQEQVDPAVVQQGVERQERATAGPASPNVLQFSSLSSDGFLLSPTEEYGVLAIPPQTPPRRHSRQTSSSSLESTPEVTEGPVESLRLGIEYLDLGLPRSDDTSLSSSWTTTATGNEGCSSPSARPRALADPLVILQHDAFEEYPDFAVSPLSSHTPLMFN